MIKRIIKFTKDDWKHIFWLIKSMIKNFIKGDFNEMADSHYFTKLHLSYDSNRIK